MPQPSQNESAVASDTVSCGPCSKRIELSYGQRHLIMPASDHEKHYICLDFSLFDDREVALREYRSCLNRLENQGVCVVYERLFGELSARSEVVAVRRQHYAKVGVCEPPLTFVEGAVEQYGIAGLVMWGVRALPNSSMRIERLHDNACGDVRATVVSTLRQRAAHIAQVTDSPADGPEPFGRFRGALNRMTAHMHELGFVPGDLVRTWVYLSNISSNYAAFNEARRGFFAENNIDFSATSAFLPASTGIEGRSRTDSLITIDAYCIDRSIAGSRIERVYNRLQSEAEGEFYLQRPTFARGMLIDDGEHSELQISGTASIDETGRTVHQGKPADQIRKTLANVIELLRAHKMELNDLCQATYYFSSPQVRSCFDDVRREMGFESVLGPCVRTTICRPDLLFEFDGVAISNRRGQQ